MPGPAVDFCDDVPTTCRRGARDPVVFLVADAYPVIERAMIVFWIIEVPS